MSSSRALRAVFRTWMRWRATSRWRRAPFNAAWLPKAHRISRSSTMCGAMPPDDCSPIRRLPSAKSDTSWASPSRVHSIARSSDGMTPRRRSIASVKIEQRRAETLISVGVFGNRHRAPSPPELNPRYVPFYFRNKSSPLNDGDAGTNETAPFHIRSRAGRKRCTASGPNWVLWHAIV